MCRIKCDCCDGNGLIHNLNERMYLNGKIRMSGQWSTCTKCNGRGFIDFINIGENCEKQ